MIYLRSALYLFGQTISAIVIFMSACLFFFSRKKRYTVISYWARFNIWTLRIVCRLDYRIHGLENVPGQPAVILCNHQSVWETLMVQKIFETPVFVLKKSLLFIPFFGWGLAMYGPIAINRSRKIKALDQLIKQGDDRLNNGRSVVIFPEGTRQPAGRLAGFRAGGAIISKKTDKSVIPIVHNAGLFWPKNSFIKYPGIIDIHIGPSITADRKKVRQINDEARDWIENIFITLPQQRN